MTEFKTELQKLIDEAAWPNEQDHNQDPVSFKAGCFFLMPMIEELMNQRDESVGYQEHLSSREKLYQCSDYDKYLLNLLRGSSCT